MPLLTNSRIAEQLDRETQELFYSDIAKIYQYTVTGYDDYGQPETTTVSTEISCSFTDKISPERWKDFADVAEFVAEIRFQSPTPSKGNRVELKDFFDTAYTDKTYEIAGIRDRGEFGYVCALKDVKI